MCNPPRSHYFLVLFFDDPLCLRECDAPLLFGCFVGIDLFLLQKLARHEVRIAAQQNVGTATGHVRGDRDRTLSSGLRNDFSFALVILRVQHVVRDFFFHQAARDQLRVFN